MTSAIGLLRYAPEALPTRGRAAPAQYPRPGGVILVGHQAMWSITHYSSRNDYEYQFEVGLTWTLLGAGDGGCQRNTMNPWSGPVSSIATTR